ncbi:uncharacterized protein [Ptychodera flava]|uniref:uncharacterized protein n=1 Tax=Ptychodera flava TaxID=63121 RepID=UPI00396A131D
MAHGMSTPLSNRPVRMMHVNSCCRRTGLMAVVNMQHLRFVYALFAIILTGSGANGDGCQLNCTVPRDPEGNIKFESLTRGCLPFPFGDNPIIHHWQVAPPRRLQVEERNYMNPCGDGLLLGLVIKWLPPEYSIDKLRGFQVRVTPLSAVKLEICHSCAKISFSQTTSN